MSTEKLLPGKFYHIFNHANGYENIFTEDTNYIYFIAQLRKYLPSCMEVIAFCLLPNHFHLLVRTKSIEMYLDSDLNPLDHSKIYSQQLSNLFNSYTKAFNKKYNRKGSLFMKNFKRKEVTNKSYLINLIIYIHLNPIQHQIVDDFRIWPYTSFNYYFEEIEDELIEIKKIKGLVNVAFNF